jgi:N-acyl-D-aspartate/D-glutamate deacylase
MGPTVDYEVILRHGFVSDGSGQPPVVADVALQGERVLPGSTTC